MAEATDTWGILYQNLIDAGCEQETAEQCLSLMKARKSSELMRLLSQHRDTLLDTIHKNQKRIDCLDFLVYQMRKRSLLKF